MPRYHCLALLLLLTSLIPIVAAEEPELTVEVIATDLGIPWGMAWLADNTLLISQRQGKLSVLNLTTRQLQPISGLPAIKVAGQGGLLDVAVAADHSHTGWIYFSYVKDINGQGTTTLARAKLAQTKLVNWQDLLISESTTSKAIHFGGRISFDNAGHLFLSIGDRGVRANGQNRLTHAGSILRLNLEGSVPSDNPFIDNANALPEIWSYGHRNPQGLYFNQLTQQLWATEHGPRGGDEVNLIEPGNNYGWPVISYGQEYWVPLAVGQGTEQAGMRQPVYYYVPSIATSNIIQYSGKLFPEWKNNLLVAALKLKHINRLVLTDKQQVQTETRHLASVNARIRNILEGRQGELYLATDQGQILLIKPASND